MSLLSATLKDSKNIAEAFRPRQITRAVQEGARRLTVVSTPASVVNEAMHTTESVLKPRTIAERLKDVEAEKTRLIGRLADTGSDDFEANYARVRELRVEARELIALEKEEQSLKSDANPFGVDKKQTETAGPANPYKNKIKIDHAEPTPNEVVLDPQNTVTELFSNEDIEAFAQNIKPENVEILYTLPDVNFRHEMPVVERYLKAAQDLDAQNSQQAVARQTLTTPVPKAKVAKTKITSPERTDAEIRAIITELENESANSNLPMQDYEKLAREVNRLEASLAPKVRLSNEDSSKLPLFSVRDLDSLADETSIDDPRLREPFIEYIEGFVPAPARNKAGLGNLLNEGPTSVDRIPAFADEGPTSVDLKPTFADEEVTNPEAMKFGDDSNLELWDNSLMTLDDEESVIANAATQPEPVKVPPTLRIVGKTPESEMPSDETKQTSRFSVGKGIKKVTTGLHRLSKTLLTKLRGDNTDVAEATPTSRKRAVNE